MTSFTSPTKPLGGKAYGSIGHLPNSRLGTGDWHIEAGQFRILTEKPRPGDRIIVSEKLDGACMAVANIDGEIVPLIRAGYRARHGRYEHLKLFEVFVAQRYAQFASLLKPGERVAGEWLALAHGTAYDPKHPNFRPFVPFDIFRGKNRVLADEFRARCEAVDMKYAAYMADGPSPVTVETALKRLGEFGQHGSTEPVEGVVYRCEREGRVEFLAKWVRPDKADGKYLASVSGGEERWYWRPSDPTPSLALPASAIEGGTEP
jgi:hypothetical protein